MDIEELCEKEDEKCLLDIEDFKNNPTISTENGETPIPVEGTDDFYKSDPMFSYI